MDKPFPAYRGNEPYVFVCYAHDDAEVVYAELSLARQRGTHIWYDEGISAGHIWRAEIADAIEGAAKVLFYISKASVASDHCRREIHYALDKGLAIVPVYLEQVTLPGDLEMGLSLVQALHRRNDANYLDHLLRALDQAPVSPARPSRAPELKLTRQLALPILAAIVIVAGFLWWAQAKLPDTRGDAPILSIAVLPFEDLAGDHTQAYLVDGMTEALTAELAKIKALKVISRTSAGQPSLEA